jgi:hypothetical protein
MAIRFTDVMLKVSDLAGAVRALEHTLGFAQVQHGEGWVMLADSTRSQRIVLTAGDFGSNWALGCARHPSDKHDLQLEGWDTAALSSLSEKGFALITHETGLFAVIYQ